MLNYREKMSSRLRKKWSFLWLLVLLPFILQAQDPQYGSNPFTFSIPEPVYGDPNLGSTGDQFFAVDLNHDGLLDFSFRSETKLYAYDHDGTQMWNKSISHPQGNGGAKHAAADIDGDGQIEIIALNNADQLLIYNGSNGTLERTIDIPGIGTAQIASHVAVANLRGHGDRDVIVQTEDILPQGSTYKYYINRALIALDLETLPLNTLWTVEQDDNLSYPESGFGGIYEGYWGQAHGSFVCADIAGILHSGISGLYNSIPGP